MGRLFEEELTRSVIGAFYVSYNKLGYGFLETVCVSALAIELRRRCHSAEREVPIPVHYDGEIIGAYKADLVVDGKLIVEVKAEPTVTGIHERQLRNYLAATTYEIGIILAYGLEPKHKRMIHTRNLKKNLQNPWPLPSHPSDPCEHS
jgi:GxxExxY protein